jgi:[acyl-carrier-protein] S-malonyltransferase
MNGENIPMKDRWVVMFPGQGSQFIGMGKDFHSQSQRAREIYELANEIAQKDITKLCFKGPISKLSNTDNLQISITATNLVTAQTLFANTGIKPSVVLGHSVGEYSALQVAGSLTTENALKLAFKRGSLMQREAKLEKGQMYAIKNVLPKDLNKILNSLTEKRSIVIANDNSESQQVISGEKSAMSKVLNHCSENNIEAIKLPVNGAWHSNLMQGCVEEFHQYLMATEMLKPNISYINNLTAQASYNVTEIQENLVTHITAMVRWRESIEGLINQGHRKFIEVGPKKILSRLLESIAGDTEEFTIEQVETIKDVVRLGG